MDNFRRRAVVSVVDFGALEINDRSAPPKNFSRAAQDFQFGPFDVNLDERDMNVEWNHVIELFELYQNLLRMHPKRIWVWSQSAPTRQLGNELEPCFAVVVRQRTVEN